MILLIEVDIIQGTNTNIPSKSQSFYIKVMFGFIDLSNTGYTNIIVLF